MAENNRCLQYLKKKKTEKAIFTNTEKEEDNGQKNKEKTVMLEEVAFMPQVSVRLIRRQDGTVYQIGKERTVIGSGAMADVCICHNNAISRSHVTILCIGGSYYIEDNQSKNGTFINERRLQAGVREPLYDGMILRFANEDFDFSEK